MLTYLKLYALFNILNGVVMIVAPELWYLQTPGASDTGPYNIHFVRDIGIAFLGAGLGLLYGVTQQHLTALDTACAALIFIGGHGLLHVVEMFAMNMSIVEVSRDSALVVLPALIAIFFVLVLRKDKGNVESTAPSRLSARGKNSHE